MARKGPRTRRLQPQKEAKIRPSPIPTWLRNSPLAKIGIIFRPIAKITPPYIKNSWAELKQTTWPNRRESWNLTIAVFIFAIVFGLVIAGVDKGFDQIFRKVVLK